MLKKPLEAMFARAHTCNTENIVRLIKMSGVETRDICDVGAGDGIVTGTFMSAFPEGAFYAIDIDEANIRALQKNGLTVYRGDLNQQFPVDSGIFDVVIANQVIEHLYDTDLFLEEIFRVLKPGGLAVVSTENLASWHNVAALLLGWQPFSLTNISKRAGGVGNPFALHGGKAGNEFPMQHHRLFATGALQGLMVLHGFEKPHTLGAGYYPLPASVGRFEPSHAHFISVSARKPMSVAPKTSSGPYGFLLKYFTMISRAIGAATCAP